MATRETKINKISQPSSETFTRKINHIFNDINNKTGPVLFFSNPVLMYSRPFLIRLGVGIVWHWKNNRSFVRFQSQRPRPGVKLWLASFSVSNLLGDQHQDWITIICLVLRQRPKMTKSGHFRSQSRSHYWAIWFISV